MPAPIPGDEPRRAPVGELGEPWRWGIETSQLMAERLLEMYGELGTGVAGGLGRDLDEELRRMQIDIERWVDLSVDVFDRTLAIVRRLAGDGRDPPTGAEVVSLETFAGTVCSGQVWVHNVSGEERAAPCLRCTGLATASGAQIGPSSVRFDVDPAPLATGTSRSVTVSVEVPDSAPPAVYHGLILSDASPESVIPLRVRVLEPEPLLGDD